MEGSANINIESCHLYGGNIGLDIASGRRYAVTHQQVKQMRQWRMVKTTLEKKHTRVCRNSWDQFTIVFNNFFKSIGPIRAFPIKIEYGFERKAGRDKRCNFDTKTTSCKEVNLMNKTQITE